MTKEIIKRYSRRRPWVILDGHTTQQIIDQVDACPSGALSYEKVTT